MSNSILARTISGSGPAIVFLHGFCESQELWTDFVKPLTSQFQVVILDLPGHGRSEVPSDFSMESQAEQVHQTLQELNVNKCLLVGHSMGGYVSLAFAGKYPQMLRGLCLFHSSALPDTQEKKESRNKTVAFVQKYGVHTFMESFVAPLFAANNREACQAAIEQMQSIGKTTRAETVIGCLQAMRDRTDRTEVLKKVLFPVLFIAGKEDPAVPLEATLQQCHLPENATACFLAQVGHMGMWEKPVATRKALLKFAETLS